MQALLFAVLRRWGLAQALVGHLAARKPPPPVFHLLGCALALLGDGRDPAMYADHTLVDEAVGAAGLRKSTARQAAFINACLRRYLRERAALVAQIEASDPVAKWNLPRWWLERLQLDHPDHWQAIALSGRQMPPMVLRVNRRRTDVATWMSRAMAAGLASTACGADAVRLLAPRPVQAIPGFVEGEVSVQDEAAQRAALLLLQGLPPRADGQRWRILDACAAPGGKTAHLLECADAEVLAIDIDPQRCERIRENLQRLGLRADVIAADAADPAAWWDGKPFDAVLLDAPCTASGIVRRHPDIPWLRRPSDVEQLAARQQTLLATLWPLLAVGGRLLYCTCSVFKSEGEFRAAAFLARNTDVRLLDSPGHLLPVNALAHEGMPDNSGCAHDGFYYALFEKVTVAGS